MSYDLTGEKISFTYGRVVQVVSGSYYDGFGNVLPIGTSSVVISGSTSGFATTGSNTFIGNQIISGSVIVTNGITGSLQGTASYSLNTISASYALTASYSNTSSYSNNSTSASYSLTASYWSGSVISASYALTASYALNAGTATNVSGGTVNVTNITASNISASTISASNYYGINATFNSITSSGPISVSGSNAYIQLLPVGSISIPSNTTASYIYVSGSTNDLYFTQYAGPYTNTTRLRWLESNIYTGILYGGTLSSTPGSTTFNIKSGSGLIVAMNATTGSDPYPTLINVSWPDYNNIPITYSGSAKISYISIDNTGSVFQQTDAWGSTDINEWDNKIVLGTVLHLSGSVSTGVFNSPQISYGYPQKTDDFTRAFGPLKISGHVLQASGSTLGITKTGGTSYREGAGYVNNPNHPSTVIENAINTSKIYRYHLSGSTPIIDTGISNAGYSVLDNTKYVNTTTGQLVTVSGGGNNQFTIQRIFWFPNSPTNAFIAYYGNGVYGSLLEAKNAIDTEPFTEAPNTALNAIFVGYVIMEGDAVNLTTTGKSAIIQGGLFRSVGGVGASGVPSVVTSLASLSDVTITIPTYGDLLMFDSTYWYNTKVLSGSYTLSGSLTTNDGLNVVSITASNISASRITGSLYGTSSWANNVISSSYALTASFALNGGGGGTTLVTGSTYPITSSWSNNTISASYALTSSYAVTASYALNSATASYCINPFPISGSLGYWGSFWDTTTQTNASSSNAMRLNSTDSNSNGVRIVSGSKITFDHDGVYNIQFSAVFDKPNANSDDINVWLVKNGNTVPDSNTLLTMAGQAKTVAAWNFVTKLFTGDNVELYWQSAEPTITIYYQTTQSAVIPATPSLIVTATQVTNTQIAASASYATTASYALNAGGTTLTTGSTYPITSSWSNNSLTASYWSGSTVSSSYALTASYTLTSQTVSSSYASTASYVITAQTASYYNGSVISSSYSLSSSYAPTNTNITASWSFNSVTASYANFAQSVSASYAITASYANLALSTSYYGGSIISSSYALTASYAPSNTNITASWSNNSVTASYTLTNNVQLLNGTGSNTFAVTGSNTFTGNQTVTNGFVILTQVSASLNFVDDTAAAAGGVPLGGLYRNGNFILIRLT